MTEAGEGAGEAVCQIRMTSLASLIGAMPAAPVQPKSLVRKALLLLVGIPSDVFPYDPVSFESTPRRRQLRFSDRILGLLFSCRCDPKNDSLMCIHNTFVPIALLGNQKFPPPLLVTYWQCNRGSD